MNCKSCVLKIISNFSDSLTQNNTTSNFTRHTAAADDDDDAKMRPQAMMLCVVLCKKPDNSFCEITYYTFDFRLMSITLGSPHALVCRTSTSFQVSCQQRLNFTIFQSTWHMDQLELKVHVMRLHCLMFHVDKRREERRLALKTREREVFVGC